MINIIINIWFLKFNMSDSIQNFESSPQTNDAYEGGKNELQEFTDMSQVAGASAT